MVAPLCSGWLLLVSRISYLVSEIAAAPLALRQIAWRFGKSADRPALAGLGCRYAAIAPAAGPLTPLRGSCGYAAWSGLSRPHDEPREGRRTLPWRTLSAPEDPHHQQLLCGLPGYGVANMGRPAKICFRWHPCQLNPFTRLAVG